MKKIIISLTVLVFIGLAVYRVIVIRKEAKNIAKKEELSGVPVTVIKPAVDYIESTLVFVGDIKGEDQAYVFSEAPGKLIEYKVRENDTVGKDDVIALVDRAMTGMDYEPFRVKSPIAGKVGRIYLDRGATINPMDKLALVVKMENVKIEIAIPEKYLTKVQMSQNCLIKVNAYPGKVFRGDISKLSPVLNPQDRSLYAEILLDNTEGLLRPGMFAEVSIIIDSSRGIVLPVSSVRHNLDTGEYFVFAEENGIARKKTVRTGIIKIDRVEVKNGVAADDRVIDQGSEFIKDGDAVEVTE